MSFAATIETTIDDEEEDEDDASGAGAGAEAEPWAGAGDAKTRRRRRRREARGEDARDDGEGGGVGDATGGASKAPPILSRDIFPGASVGWTGIARRSCLSSSTSSSYVVVTSRVALLVNHRCVRTACGVADRVAGL